MSMIHLKLAIKVDYKFERLNLAANFLFFPSDLKTHPVYTTTC